MLATMEDLRNGSVAELGVTEWFNVTQELIDKFSELTTDDQWIHVDVERAKAGPFGATVAHGYLMVSLLSQFLDELLQVSDRKLTVNYGIEKLRFTGPVRSDNFVRCRMRVVEVRERTSDIIARMYCEIEVRGVTKPALVAEILFLFR